MKNAIHTDGQPTDGAIVLKCTSDDFAKFITGLLGRPQTIGKVKGGSFDIAASHIEDLHLLLDQRINDQNNNQLIQFTCRIVFSDNSSVLLNTIEDVMSYREVRPIVSTSVNLTWQYLVHFKDRETPERQEIEVNFMTHPGRSIRFEDDEGFIVGSGGNIGAGLVSYQIKHTARTWGSDIQALLAGHLDSLLDKPSKVRNFVRRHSGKIAFGFGASLFSSSVLIALLTALSLKSAQSEKVEQLLSSTSDVSEKLDFILSAIASGAWPTYFYSVILFLVVSLVASILLGAWIESAGDRSKPSFITLTSESEKDKKRMLKKYERSWASFVSSIVVGIITGVVGNILFHFLFGQN